MRYEGEYLGALRGAGRTPSISVVTATLGRPDEVSGLIDNLARQSLPPVEFIVVDGGAVSDDETEKLVELRGLDSPFDCIYLRNSGGTALQRNMGLEAATGAFIAFVDDDIRLEPDFFAKAMAAFEVQTRRPVGGVLGYRSNEHFSLQERQRWRWYRRLRLLRSFEAGRYDFATGYPVNIHMQTPFSGVREVDFISASCAVWRREVFDSGLRFDPFFTDYGVLEDAHLALRASRSWTLLQCGEARCTHLRSSKGRVSRRKIGYKSVVNYYFVFRDVAGPLTLHQQLRFWRFQAFELLRIVLSGLRRRRASDFSETLGRVNGIVACIRGLSPQVRR